MPWSPIPCESTEKFEQLVGLIVKFGLSMLTAIERIRIGTPPMMLRDGVGDRAHLRGARIDVERDADDDDAVVIRSGQRGGDRREAEGRPFERPRQVHLPDRVERVASRPGGDVGRPDLGGGGTARGRQLGPAELLGGGQDRGFRTVGDAPQVAGEAGRHPEVEVAEELVAVVAVELQVEVRERTRVRIARSCLEARLEGTDLRRGIRHCADRA